MDRHPADGRSAPCGYSSRPGRARPRRSRIPDRLSQPAAWRPGSSVRSRQRTAVTARRQCTSSWPTPWIRWSPLLCIRGTTTQAVCACHARFTNRHFRLCASAQCAIPFDKGYPVARDGPNRGSARPPFRCLRRGTRSNKRPDARVATVDTILGGAKKCSPLGRGPGAIVLGEILA